MRPASALVKRYADAMPGPSEPHPGHVDATLRALRRRVFAADVSSLPTLQGAVVVAARFAWLTVDGFFLERLETQAASLAYMTLLATVPALALAFALADVSGATALLLDGTVAPFLAGALGDPRDPTLPVGVRALRETADALLALVRSTRATGLGAAGLITCGWALLRVVRGVEGAFAQIFRAPVGRRSLGHRARALLFAAVTMPLGLGYALTTATLSHGTYAERWTVSLLPYEPLRAATLFAAPPLVVCLTLFGLYRTVPSAKVPARSAWLGAGTTALAWYALQLLHIQLQVSLARWNAIYSGFGAFPILLMSIRASWVLVLLGARSAAMHSRGRLLRDARRSRPA